MTCSGRRRSSSRVSTLKAGRLSVRGTAAIKLSLCTRRRKEEGSVSLRRSTHLKTSSSCARTLTAFAPSISPFMGRRAQHFLVPRRCTLFSRWQGCHNRIIVLHEYTMLQGCAGVFTQSGAAQIPARLSAQPPRVVEAFSAKREYRSLLKPSV